MSSEMEHLIAGCRKSFGRSPREMSWFWLWRTKMPVPMWVRICRDKRFVEIFRDQECLLRRGDVTWGAVVQANSQLFEPGGKDCPAAILYSTAPEACAEPEILEEAASMLFSVKGEEVEDRELQVFADKLEDEHVTDMKLPVPTSLTMGIPCFYTCIMVHRKHLPNRRLSSGLFPIVVNERETEATMILPSKYWPAELVQMWDGGEVAEEDEDL